MKKYLVLFLFSACVAAQTHQTAPTPRDAKKGEERIPMLAKDGTTKCGTIARVDNRWYVYLLEPKELSNAVSPAFDTRKEALPWALRYCPKQGIMVVGK